VAVTRDVRPVCLVALIILIVAVVTPLLWRARLVSTGPEIEIVFLNGTRRSVTLAEMKRLPVLERRGSYQNQYGNWRDEGVYRGVPLLDLIGRGADYAKLEVTADDGYHIEIERARVEDEDYPMILAYTLDGVSVPAWESGFRIAVLPADGAVSNDEYRTTSAGSFWAQNVRRLALLASTHP